jgi:hypothetical protein
VAVKHVIGVLKPRSSLSVHGASGVLHERHDDGTGAAVGYAVGAGVGFANR